MIESRRSNDRWKKKQHKKTCRKQQCDYITTLIQSHSNTSTVWQSRGSTKYEKNISKSCCNTKKKPYATYWWKNSMSHYTKDLDGGISNVTFMIVVNVVVVVTYSNSSMIFCCWECEVATIRRAAINSPFRW